MKDDIFVVAGSRTPMGSFQGVFQSLSAVDLGAHVIKASIEKAGISFESIDEVMMGCVLSAGLGQGPARQASRKAGVPDQTGCITINKLCGSGMKAIMLGFDSIRAKTNQIVIAGGMENMTNAPYLIKKARSGYRMGHGEIYDHMFYDGLEDADTHLLMGKFAQNTADAYHFTRTEMDDFAISSLKKAQLANENGSFTNEIDPFKIQNRNGSNIITTDEQPFKANIHKIPQLKPAFSENGTITAANASSISDGAAAIVLMNQSTVSDKNIKPLAKIIGHSTESCHPAAFTTAPTGSIKKLLTKIGWSIDMVDLFEINEAFAVVTMATMQDLNISESKVNIHGGACALGHPIGATGCRIILTLIHALIAQKKQRGIASLCIGGGEATAVAVEILNN